MPNVSYHKDVYAWVAHMLPSVGMNEVIRCTLYTYLQGSEEDLREVEAKIRKLSFCGHNNALLPNQMTPSVFKKARGKKAKGVDIGICVDAHSHAARDHYDTAVILSGDRDILKLIPILNGSPMILFETGSCLFRSKESVVIMYLP